MKSPHPKLDISPFSEAKLSITVIYNSGKIFKIMSLDHLLFLGQEKLKKLTS